MRLTAHLNLPAPGRSQSVYVGLDNALARSCVFAKQSLGTILCGRSLLPLAGHILPAPLIPKLRGHFAEFLFRESLEPLRLLASPTCVGLRYGQRSLWSAKLFSAVCVGRPLRSPRTPSASVLGYPGGFAYQGPPTTLQRKSTTRRQPCSCVPPRTHNGLVSVREC